MSLESFSFSVRSLTGVRCTDTEGELAKRLAIFGVSGVAGNMFLGILQAALYKNLNGAHGLGVSRSLHSWHYPSKFSVANSRCDRDGNGSS